MKKKLLLTAAVTVVSTTLSASAEAAPKWAKKGETIVKCRGVAKKGMNDCGANGHSCSGMAKKDNDKNEWVYTPKGLCEKLTGGVVYKTKVVK